MGASQPPGLRTRDIRRLQSAYMVATRQRTLPDGLTNDTTNNSLNSRGAYFAPARAALADIVLAFPGFGSSLSETDLPTGYSVTASIEYPSGTFTPVYTDAGARSLTVTPGRAVAKFAPCPISIPAGAKFWVKCWATWTAGAFWLSSKAHSHIPGDWTIRGTGLTDQTLTTTAFTTTSADGFGPAIFGRLSSVTAVLGLLGDSITMPIVDSVDPTTGAGFIERAMRGQIPTLNLSRSSSTLADYMGRREGRDMIFRDSITHLVMSHGRNDLALGDPAVFFQPNIQKVVDTFSRRGVAVYGVTVTPQCSSSDGWVTAGNQTLDATMIAREARRQAHNTWLRANWRSVGMTGIFDWAWVVDPTDSGKWSSDGTAGTTGAGFAALTGSAVSGVTMATYSASTSGGTGYPASTTVPCDVAAWPGTPGAGAVIVGNTTAGGAVTTYTVQAGGAGYVTAPMVAPRGAWTGDGTHPNHRGYNEIIKATGLSPDTFVL